MRDDRDDDDWDDDPDDSDSDDETDVLPCPNCGADVYSESVRCPACGEYVTHETRVWSGKPLWYVLLALAGIVAVVIALSGV